MDFNKIEEENFFIIDSNNIKNYKTQLYGYAIYEHQIICNKQLKQNMNFDGTGAYVYVNVDSNTIKISQDLNGSFGIYYYENKNYFALSNSFIKLLEHLRNKFELSLNYDYAKTFISAELCSHLYDETLVNEIKILDRNIIVNINKNNSNVTFDEFDYEENTISLNSKKGIQILDQWFDKWFNVIRNILKNSSNLSCDLTGGFDSRTVMALLIASKINLNNIEVNSLPYIHEDFKIASKIASDFNFKLNKDLNVEFDYIKSVDDFLNISFYTKMGFSKGLHPINAAPKDTVYVLTGFGGECIRGYPKGKLENDIKYKKIVARRYSKEFGDSAEQILKNNYKKLNKKFPVTHKDDLRRRLYKETRSPYHYGRSVIERFLANYIYLTPLIDPLLYKLKFVDEHCEDTYLIVATIYDRYCSRLLEYDVQGGRNIEESTIVYAKKINQNFPISDDKSSLKMMEFENNLVDHNKLKTTRNFGISHTKVITFLRDIFYTNSFKNFLAL